MTRQRHLRLLWATLGTLLALAVIAGAALTAGGGGRGRLQPFTLNLDPGTTLSGPAPDFSLRDQFGASVSLHSLRGKVVMLAFNDSKCTNVCPLTTTAMIRAKRLLGPAGGDVALLGVDANPHAISIADVRSYSERHGMTRSWQFLTGTLPLLRRVWKAYKVEVAIQGGQIDHTPALFVISPGGRLARLYLTQMSYSSIDQQAQLLAQEASRLIPTHPRVLSQLSYAQIPAILPSAAAVLDRADGGTVRLGPGAPRLLAFFATWDSQVTDLAKQLDGLDHYAAVAGGHGLPGLVAIDEASVEPSRLDLSRFLANLPHPLGYPVGVDATGRVADGYGVQDEPWLVLVSRSGQVLWYYDVSTSGWLPVDKLMRYVRAALSRPATTSSAAAVHALLAGSPAPLAALHQQANRLLGSLAALGARLHGLRGYPVVLNAWASWCSPCRQEFSLFAAASAHFGRHVAFVGVDTGDSPGDARAFLTGHPVSYPSYQSPSVSGLGSLSVISGLPTTIFIDRSGKVVYVHTGQYESLGTLEADVSGYARGA
ncbi:MAG: redoxin domain-containing protein [Solirubrobacteraceae bacterium]